MIDISDNQDKYKDGSFAKKFIKVKYLPKATVYPLKYTGQVKESKELTPNRVPVTVHGDEYANCFKYKSNKREKGSSEGNSKGNCHSSEPIRIKHIINPIVAKSLPPESKQFFNVSKEIDKKQRKVYREKLDRIEAKVQDFAENRKEFTSVVDE